MPLIIITGTPCSGKTFRAQQIQKDFEARIRSQTSYTKVSIVYLPSYHASLDPSPEEDGRLEPPEQSLNPRDAIYHQAKLEKTARAEEFSAIKRCLDKNTVVIADGPNYIKGFRYQLFCEAKAAGTRSIVLHTAATEDECRAWNMQRLEARAWSTEDKSAVTENTTVISGPKVGSDVRGDLQPESHTAIYGDKPLYDDDRSDASSTGAVLTDDEDRIAERKRPGDTMTLKSLYIADHARDRPAEGKTALIADTPSSNPAQHQNPLSMPTPAPSIPPSPRASLPYSAHTLTSLFMRYEPPSPFTRWDTPLFTVPSTDAHPPYQAIWDALFPIQEKSKSKKALSKIHAEEQARQAQQRRAQQQTEATPRPITTPTRDQLPQVRMNVSTTLPSATVPNALQTLESTTGEIVKTLLTAARSADLATGAGGTLTLTFSTDPTATATAAAANNDTSPPTPEITVEIQLPENLALNQPMLQRLRRKYTQIQRGGIAHRQGYVHGRSAIIEDFTRFLQLEFEAAVLA